MKKVFLTIGILALLVSCGKSDWRISYIDRYFKDNIYVTEKIIHKENLKFFKGNLDDFTNKKVDTTKYIDNELNMEKSFENKELSKVSMFKEEIYAQNVEITEVGSKKYITTFLYEFKYDYSFENIEAASFIIFSEEKPSIKNGDKIIFTLLPYMNFVEEDMVMGEKAVKKKSTFVVADYEIVK